MGQTQTKQPALSFDAHNNVENGFNDELYQEIEPQMVASNYFGNDHVAINGNNHVVINGNNHVVINGNDHVAINIKEPHVPTPLHRSRAHDMLRIPSPPILQRLNSCQSNSQPTQFYPPNQIYSPSQFASPPYNSLPHNPLPHNPLPHNPLPHNPLPHNPAQPKYNTVWHSSVRGLNLNKELPIKEENKAMGTTLILDETGSMASMKEEPVQSVNAYVKIQKQSGFDVNIRIVRFAQVIKDMTRNVSDPELEIDDYDPDGMTALIDAVIYVILTATEAQHVLITTDGDDNSSVYSIKTLNKLIERAEQAGWTFTFIGCTKEAYKQGTQFKMSSQPIDLTDPTAGFSQSTEPYLDGTPPQNPSLFMAMRCVSDNTTRLNRQYTNSVRHSSEPPHNSGSPHNLEPH
jgi:hypothetical protein